MAKDVLKYNEEKTVVIGLNVPKKDLKEVVVPAGVKNIGPRVFQKCKELQKVVLPKGLKTIEESAFEECVKLKDMDIPDSVRFIEDRALCGCESLTKICIPDKIKKIGKWSFWGCGFSELTIPESVEVIDESSFGCLFRIQKLYLPKSLKEIKRNGLSCLSNVLGIPPLPEGIKKLGKGALSHGKFGIVALPASVEEIGDELLYSCNFLKEIRVAPENKHFAVANNALCSKDGKVLYHYPFGIKDSKYQVPEGVEIIKEKVFIECQHLHDVKLPSTLKVIESMAFLRCHFIKHLEFPEGFTTICSEAFEKCTSLESVSLPSSITTIEKDAFAYCTGLKTIICNSKEPVALVRDAILKWSRVSDIEVRIGVGKNGRTTYPIIHVPVGTKSIYKKTNGWKTFEIVDDVVDGQIVPDAPRVKVVRKRTKDEVVPANLIIKNGVKAIRKKAYIDNQEIETVYMSDSVLTVGEDAFKGCKKLKSLHFSLNLESINVGAFDGCKSLREIVLPKKLTTIDDYAFRECSSLTSVEFPLSFMNTKIGFNAFAECKKLQKIVIKKTSPDKFDISTCAFTERIYNTCTLVVPIAAVKAYKNHEVFGKFKNITTPQ